MQKSLGQKNQNLNEILNNTNRAQEANEIKLQTGERMERWIHKSTLIGETLSIDHLVHLPTLLSIHSDKVAGMKYLRGTKALLTFDSTVAAEEFLENKKIGRVSSNGCHNNTGVIQTSVRSSSLLGGSLHHSKAFKIAWICRVSSLAF